MLGTFIGETQRSVHIFYSCPLIVLLSLCIAYSLVSNVQCLVSSLVHALNLYLHVLIILKPLSVITLRIIFAVISY